MSCEKKQCNTEEVNGCETMESKKECCTPDGSCYPNAEIESLKTSNGELMTNNRMLFEQNRSYMNSLSLLQKDAKNHSLELENTRKNISMKFARAMVKNLDLLEQAKAVSSNNPEVYKGMEMIIMEYKRSLQECGINQITCQTNDPINPEFHEIIQDNHGGQVIKSILSEGYIFEDLLIKPVQIEI